MSSIAKDPIKNPGDLTVENNLQASEISLPDSSIFSCKSGEIASVVSESAFSSYLTSNTISTPTILAKNSEILLTGSLKITGSVSYASDLQTSEEENSTFLRESSSFLEIKREHWKDLNFFEAQTKGIEVERIPIHRHLQIIGNCHCEIGDVMLIVDGNVEWMQNCKGSNHFRVVVNHDSHTAKVQFVGSERTDPVMISFK